MKMIKTNLVNKKLFKSANIVFILTSSLFGQLLLAETTHNNAPIIQPGAPGMDSKNLDPEAASDIASTSYVEADVKFLEGMIIHHQQAILMSQLASKRTNNKTIVEPI